ncbi:MAG: hypothetical protein JWO03_943 [Bacteroidetes bacterium]|nr:hypothetical protein [Bacteroidota bacterium]
MIKKTCIALSLCLSLIIGLSSCSKTSFDQPGFPGLRCNPDGIEYIADTAFYLRTLGTTIHAQTGGHDKIIIYLQHTDTTGSVALDTVNNYAYYLDGTDTYESVNGNVTITQYYNDSLHVMNGTFGFNARARSDHSKTINVSYGYFNGIPRH